MDIGSILLIMALVLLTGTFIALPVVRGEGREVSDEEIAHSAQLAERERVLEALLELDFDYELGKVPEEIYPAQRARLVSKAADVLAKLDESAEAVAAADDVEQAIAARKTTHNADDPLEAMIAERRGTQPSTPAKQPAKPAGKSAFCPECGSAVQAEDKFCVACGNALI